MRFSGGKIYESIDSDMDCVYRVTEAVLTPRKLSMDWHDCDEFAHLDATSKDGMNYKGIYGYSLPDADCRMELKRFNAKDGSVMFLASWWERETGEEQECLIYLEP